MPNSKPAPVQALFEGNARFSERFARDEPALMEALSKGQSPKVFWLGWSVSCCLFVKISHADYTSGHSSDSRCPEADLAGSKPGNIFVHRNMCFLSTLCTLHRLTVRGKQCQLVP